MAVNDPISKQGDGMGTQSMPTWATYAEAMNKFSSSPEPSWSTSIS